MSETPVHSGGTDALYESFVALYTRHERQIRGFVRSLLPTWGDVDDAMQQVAVTLWKKFDSFEVGTEFLRWAFVVARFEVLHYKRSMARDRLVFSPELMELLAKEAEETSVMGQRSRESEALETCLAKLPSAQRELVTKAYTPGVTTKDLSAAAGVSAGAFYMRLNRIRKVLLSCIERTISLETA